MSSVRIFFALAASVSTSLAAGHQSFRSQAFAWIERAGYTTLFAKPMVVVKSHDARNFDNNQGFVIRRTPTTLEIETLDLQHCIFQLRDHPKITPLTAKQLVRLEADQPEGGTDWSEWVFAAYLAAKTGDEAACRKMLSLYTKDRNVSMESFKGEVGTAEFRSIVDGIFHSDQPWPSVRERLVGFLSRFPGHGLAERATSYKRVLDRMVLLEEQRNGKPFRDPIEEEVYQLRNDVGKVQRGANMLGGEHMEPMINPSAPGDKLYAAGMRAVPALIKALTDDTLTHCSYDEELFYEKYQVERVQRVGDIASSILSLITFQNFGADLYSFDWDPLQKAKQTEARVWWGKNRDDTPLQVIARGVLANDPTMQACISLGLRYPKEAPSIFRREIEDPASEEGVTRPNMMQALGRIDSPEATGLLRDRLRSDPNLDTRIAAAQALWEKHSDEALRAMIGEWKRMSEKDDVERVATFLATTHRIEALNALAGNLRNRPSAFRREVLYVMSGTTFAPMAGKTKTGNAVAFRKAAERILASELDDRGLEQPDSKASFMMEDELLLKNPLMCDLAAQDLGHLLPSRYPFRLHKKRAQMDAEIRHFKRLFAQSSAAGL